MFYAFFIIKYYGFIVKNQGNTKKSKENKKTTYNCTT